MLRWALVAVVVALGCVRADEAMVVSAADASVAAAVAAESLAAVEANSHASAGAAAGTDSAAVAGADAEAERKKKHKHHKQKDKKHKKKHHKHKRRYVGGDILFNRAMNVRGVMAAGSIVANNATVQGTLIARQLKTKRVKAHTLSVGELKTTRLSSPTGTIVVEGDLLITHSHELEYAPKKHKHHKHKGHKKGKGKGKHKHHPKPAAATPAAAGSIAAPAAAAAASPAPAPGAAAPLPLPVAKGVSFLAEDVVVRGVKQWALVRFDHFQTADSLEGWRLVGTNEALPSGSCGGASADTFLGGHCQLANGPAAKLFTHLPPHSQLRVTARYHFIDKWNGETAFAQVDTHYVWSQTHRGACAEGFTGINMCGNDAYPESRMSAPIDVSVPHTADSVSIAFGARSAGSEAGAVRSLADERANACERSFGVDDVSIYIR